MTSRDQTVDVLRGWAIVLMVLANLSSLILVHPHHLLLRFPGSFAAPLFICLSGMMVALTVQAKQYTAKHFWFRGGFILFCGVFIDVAVWHLIPCMSVDVLYLISISLPIAFYYQKLPKLVRWFILIAVFALAPIFRMYFGYTDYPTETYLWGEVATTGTQQTSVLHHWLIDGWFPVFPWIGFSFLGVNLGKWRWKEQTNSPFRSRPLLWIGGGIFLIGILIWHWFPAPMMVRDIWSDIFYPPTVGYTIIAIGVILFFWVVVDSTNNFFIYRPLSIMGKCSLFLYIAHYAIGWHILHHFWPDRTLVGFFILYTLLLLILFALANCIAALKRGWPNRPLPVRVLLGS